MKDTQEKKLVNEIFKSMYRLDLIEVKTEFGKPTPDFECYIDDRLIFAAELKTFPDQKITAANGYEEIVDEDSIISGSKKDNALNKIGNAIIDSAKQLQNYSCPRFLFILNESFLDFEDVKHVVNGFITFKNLNGEIEFIDRSGEKQVEARKALETLDLIVFINKYDKKPSFIFLNNRGKNLLLSYFGFRLVEE